MHPRDEVCRVLRCSNVSNWRGESVECSQNKNKKIESFENFKFKIVPKPPLRPLWAAVIHDDTLGKVPTERRVRNRLQTASNQSNMYEKGEKPRKLGFFFCEQDVTHVPCLNLTLMWAQVHLTYTLEMTSTEYEVLKHFHLMWGICRVLAKKNHQNIQNLAFSFSNRPKHAFEAYVSGCGPSWHPRDGAYWM